MVSHMFGKLGAGALVAATVFASLAGSASASDVTLMTSSVPETRDAAACVKPEYPANAVKDKEEGDVVLAYTVSKDGRIIDIEPEVDSAGGYLKRASYRALRKCKLPEATADSGRLKIRHRYELSFG